MDDVQTKHRILLVEDNDDTRDALAAILEQWGHIVEKAATGAACLNLIAEFEPEIVLLDIGLPDINGYKVAEALRRLPDGERIRLFAVTGYDELPDRQAAFRAGFDMHFTKPVNLTRLEATLTAP